MYKFNNYYIFEWRTTHQRTTNLKKKIKNGKNKNKRKSKKKNQKISHANAQNPPSPQKKTSWPNA